jgi:hypothetical protein
MKKNILIPFFVFVFVLVFFGQALFFSNGFIGGIDVEKYFFWHESFVKSEFMSGRVPLWNPYYYCGHPFLANPQSFVFYPITLIYVLFSLPVAFNIDTLFHIFLAVIGMYYFVKLITGNKWASLASGVIFGFGGCFMEKVFAGHLTMIHTAALLPFIFYFVEKGFQVKKIIFFIFGGLIFGLQILGGEPQNSYYTAVFISIYFCFRYFSEPGAVKFRKIGKYTLFFSLFLVITFSIAAIQILPSMEFSRYSDRVKNSYDFVTTYSYPPQCFFTFLVPKPSVRASWNELQSFRELVRSWELSGYIGVTSLMLAGIGSVFSKYRKYSLCFCVMSAISITVMLGYYTPIFKLYYKYVPGMSIFRIPSRCIIILVFSLSTLAGFGIDKLLKSELTVKFRIFLLIFVSIILIVLFGGAKFFGIPANSGEILVAAGLIVIGFIILNVIKFIKHDPVKAILLIVFLFADLYLIYSNQIPLLNDANLSKANNFENFLIEKGGFGRVAIPFYALRSMKYRYYGVNGYTPISLDHFFVYMHYMAGIPISDTARHTLNPELFKPELVFTSKILGVKYAIVENEKGIEPIVAQEAAPRAWLAGDAVFEPNLLEHLIYLKSNDFDPRKQVVLKADKERLDNPGKGEMSNPGKVEIMEYLPNRIELKSSSTNDTYLVLSELYYPGWKAYVDGSEVKIYHANYLLRAIKLSKGKHEIVFSYKPMSFYTGAGISGISVIMIGCMCVVSLRSKRAVSRCKQKPLKRAGGRRSG